MYQGKKWNGAFLMEVLNQSNNNTKLMDRLHDHTAWVQQLIDVFYLKLVKLQQYSGLAHFDQMVPAIAQLFGACYWYENIIIWMLFCADWNIFDIKKD